MRKQWVIANWKMHGDKHFAYDYCNHLMTYAKTNQLNNCQIVIVPPYVLLDQMARQLDGSCFMWGAQNVASEASGAFTGEVSVNMLADFGCQCVILGHSERRQYFAETNLLLSKKLALVLAQNLTPIFCVGETLAERETGLTESVIANQLEVILSLDSSPEIVQNIALAYEPVWAIGTGKTATSEQAQAVHQYIRGLIAKRFGQHVADNISIIYGGSVKPGNARELLSMPDIDGALVGGASLNVNEFLEITQCSNSF